MIVAVRTLIIHCVKKAIAWNDFYYAEIKVRDGAGPKNKKEWEWNITVPANTTAMVYIPVQEKEKVLEGGKIIDNSHGLTYIETKNNRQIYKADSGIYKFIVQ